MQDIVQHWMTERDLFYVIHRIFGLPISNRYDKLVFVMSPHSPVTKLCRIFSDLRILGYQGQVQGEYFIITRNN